MNSSKAAFFKCLSRNRCLAGLLCLVLAAAFSGCAPARKASTPMPSLTPPGPQPIEKVDNPGSLFQPQRAEYLFADNRATRVGDIVMVHIVEMTEASSEAETTADKESTVDVGVDSFFGKSKFLGLPGAVGETPLVGASTTNEFDSTGETTRETRIQATVAARVVRVLPNGLMEVRGGREVRVNDENQIIFVSGLIRARDIGPNNAISSNQLADAKIHLYGRGVLADKQHPGWMARIIDNVWPF